LQILFGLLLALVASLATVEFRGKEEVGIRGAATDLSLPLQFVCHRPHGRCGQPR
jgi:hypothetical protein